MTFRSRRYTKTLHTNWAISLILRIIVLLQQTDIRLEPNAHVFALYSIQRHLQVSDLFYRTVILDKLTVVQYVKTLSIFQGIRSFITIFTTHQHWILS